MLNPKQDWPGNLTNTMAFIGVAALVVIVAPWVGPIIKAASAIRQQQKTPPPSTQPQPQAISSSTMGPGDGGAP